MYFILSHIHCKMEKDGQRETRNKKQGKNMSLQKDDINSMARCWNGGMVQHLLKLCYGVMVLWCYGVMVI